MLSKLQNCRFGTFALQADLPKLLGDNILDIFFWFIEGTEGVVTYLLLQANTTIIEVLSSSQKAIINVLFLAASQVWEIWTLRWKTGSSCAVMGISWYFASVSQTSMWKKEYFYTIPYYYTLWYRASSGLAIRRNWMIIFRRFLGPKALNMDLS